MVISQDMAVPWRGSYLPAIRQTSRNALPGDLRRLRRVAHHPEHEPADPGGCGVVERREGRLVTTRGAAHQPGKGVGRARAA